MCVSSRTATFPDGFEELRLADGDERGRPGAFLCDSFTYSSANDAVATASLFVDAECQIGDIARRQLFEAEKTKKTRDAMKLRIHWGKEFGKSFAVKFAPDVAVADLVATFDSFSGITMKERRGITSWQNIADTRESNSCDISVFHR